MTLHRLMRRTGLALLLPFACAALLGAQIDPRTALIERGAWNALTAGQAHAAAEAFREAIAADPKNARLHRGAGMAASLERRDADAKESFERALALDPKLTQARALLGQIQHRMGDPSGAIRTYETLLALTPDDREARATLERWQREADLHDRMRQAIGSHFTVSFEGPAEAALASEALDILDRVYWRVGQLFGTYPSQPVPVVLYTGEQFRDITRSPTWAAGAYDGIIRVPMRGALDNQQELDRVLSHELTHALVRRLASRGVPAWLNEGLATALETGDMEWAERRVQQAQAPDRYTDRVSDGLKHLIERIDEAVQLREPDAITRRVKQELQDAIRARTVALPERFRRVRPEGYARRLLHRNDALGYTAVVMTWGPGQGTPLHDHAGIWCVEGVVEGRMDVTQYDLIEEAGREAAYRFEEKGCVHAAVGSAGCLIPPFEYHVLANALDEPSITLHVYGGEMTTCHVFEPTDDGRYVRKERPLSYHE